MNMRLALKDHKDNNIRSDLNISLSEPDFCVSL